MIRLRALALGGVAWSLAAAAFAADPSGTWAAEVDTPFGRIPYRYEIRVGGDQVRGMIRRPGARTKIREGRLDGDTISFVERVEFGGQYFRIEYRGSVSADEIHLTRRLGDFGSQSFVARRVVPGASKSLAPPGPFPFHDASLDPEKRIDDVLSRMTLEEKIACLGPRAAVPRLGIEGTGTVGGLHGLALGGPGRGSGPSVRTTLFPQAIGLAATWDPDLLRRVGAVVGNEARYVVQSEEYGRGGLIVRAPDVGLASDPRCTRGEETYGEDPFLAGALAAAFVRGLQGSDPGHGLAAALVTRVDAAGGACSSDGLDDRQRHEYALAPLRRAIEAGARGIEVADVDLEGGGPGERRFDGILAGHARSLRDLVGGSPAAARVAEAVATSVKAGLTHLPDGYADVVRTGLDRDLLSERDVDHALRGTLRAMIWLGELDRTAAGPYRDIGEEDEPWLAEDHESVARLAARESIVLLKNTDGLLPLDPAALRSIAIVGPLATEVLLDGRSGSPPYRMTPLAAVGEKLGPKVRVGFAVDDANDAAVTLAREADVAVVFVGNDPLCGAGEAECPHRGGAEGAADRVSLALGQEALVRRVREANPRTVVVLVTSFPYDVAWTREHAPAILEMAHGGQETGHALADVLFGDASPAGRLVQTWPRSAPGNGGLHRGRPYPYSEAEPLYPFGYGLTYTTFRYRGLRTSAETVRPASPVTVSVEVENTGRRAGEEVIQMYVRHVGSALVRPRRELKGFQRVPLAPGERRTVEMELRAEDLAYWEASSKAFVVESDRVEVAVGGSSADLRLRKTVRVEGARLDGRPLQ
jgi:beta-glucosidase